MCGHNIINAYEAKEVTVGFLQQRALFIVGHSKGSFHAMGHERIADAIHT